MLTSSTSSLSPNMASRRGIPRSRVNSTQTQPPPRPRSVMAELSTSTVQKVQKPSSTQPQDDAETNIQVVIRCRRRSEREIQDNSPIIVSSSGPKSHDVTIETSMPQSTLGIVTLPPTRTYPFDLVFGPEADQALIYHDVVAPMLTEVMQGYNCTLFAYGQTGTGKTYTMQGDLAPTPMGNPSAQAGMIPRVLFRLFHELEKSNSDYSVKISFVELYNEELRDLLANDLTAPIGSIQPMGQGAGASKDPNAAQAGLKIFDDSNKKGVFIQGLEEVSVKDCADALELLTKGSHRRQIAATKFNDHSSRSHSVFSITVHVKETSNMGDDLLKVGKLNLVDLAGSENIGRSGAENKRAREAGMINQSLLTLGRVINALVDHSPHVPYRESKLTRLLQDSLGGRTKTCIIATISPARSNMEETLSTLDYAMRAKSIRNKPEVNQRMTRNALLKEYVAEIERLKADLLAAREKNGIFFSEETWNQLTAEQELRQTEFAEAKKQVEIVESQMRAVREEFEQSIALLMKRDGELKATKEQLKATEGELVVTRGELTVVQEALEEEVVVREAHQETEAALNDVAKNLKKVTSESIADVQGLFNKLDRKNSVLSSNSKAVSTHGKTISSESKALAAKLEEFVKTASEHLQRLRADAKQFKISELKSLTTHSERIEEQLGRMQDALVAIQSQDKVSQEAVVAIKDVVKGTEDSIKNGMKTWSESLVSSCATLCKEVEGSGTAGLVAMEKAMKTMESLLETIVRETFTFIDFEAKSATDLTALTDSTITAEIAHLREQNERLTSLLEAERTKGEVARNELMLKISGLLGDFMAARNLGLNEAVELAKAGNSGSIKRLAELEEKHGSYVSGMVARGSDAAKVVEKKRADGKKAKEAAIKAGISARTTLTDRLSCLRGSVSGSLASYSSEMNQHIRRLSTTSSKAFDNYSHAKKARIEASSSMSKDIQSGYQHLQHGIGSTAKAIELFTEDAASTSTNLSTMMESYRKASAAHLASARQATRSILEHGTREDAPTGKTPRKRTWNYVDTWELTKSRDAVIKSWKGESRSKPISETFSTERTPLSEQRNIGRDENLVDKTPLPAKLPKLQPEETESSESSDSPLATSITSSCSSTSIPGPPPATGYSKAGGAGLKLGPPALELLTEPPTNIARRRGMRRVR